MNWLQYLFLLPAVFAMVLGLLVGCGGGGGGGSTPLSIEIFGDSIARGPGISTPMPATLRALRPAWAIDDRSASGLVLADLIAGYSAPWPGAPADAYPRGPQPPFAQVSRSARVVVLAAGLNDALEMRTPAQYGADLREAIRIVRAEGRLPVLAGIVDLPVADLFTPERVARRAELNAVTLALAAELGLQHAGWGEDYRGPVDVIDNVHRTQAASDRLAVLLAAAIERSIR
ncbi:SGNH/GDSL hydrolase family protein [Paracidovorax citrulli]|uniref:SGNH hydrolase-type esterase domain-containing protein n=2 Tax=Paracidovorax citrulli TaxID=80869 RepID=A1TPP3_PARC0|nr:SGNH/GDSL hydrolase family protein [Paracidovorax citrulli]ABM32931.1 hypothetical protein Aave_2356 [Paracidovorax citrulli AAC00-1]ATG93100.1 hypothetical protein CQB05_02770 [Paracidovorax citrulli]PVY67150.1 GDSL-like lipase/acylhydrolase family protein [Paracidovorax citrulli]REG68687.1 GDSL-like lipase/acylhydrolase family protein [Paracidovorax citrulli]RLJ93242.1 GDSL-like lipase/acylhydrolase family protein [Paracidovorax citrulli]